MKKTVCIALIFSTLLLSSCSSKMGEKATNLQSGELSSQENNAFLEGDIVSNIKDYVNVKDPSNISLNDLSPKVYSDEDFDKEYLNRIKNIILTDKDTKIEESDIVNLSFKEISVEGGSEVYDLNVGYDFLLSDLHSSFKDSIVDKNINSETITIENCIMPGGNTGTVKVKINYVTRSYENKEFTLYDSSVPVEGKTYQEWLKDSLTKYSKVQAIWEELIKTADIKTDSEEYIEYYNNKYNNAYEYYSYFEEEIGEEALKTVIEKQCKKELIAYYFANEYNISLGNYTLNEKNYLSDIALFYGYTKESFEAKYDDSDVRNNTLLIDMVGVKFLEKVYGEK